MNIKKENVHSSFINEDECTDSEYIHWWHKQEFDHSQPPVNVKESEKDYVIELAIPGFEKEDIHLHIKGNTLKINGAKKSAELNRGEDFLIREFDYHSFERSFCILQPVDASEIVVNYNRGILRVVLPKKENDSEEFIQDLKIM